MVYAFLILVSLALFIFAPVKYNTTYLLVCFLLNAVSIYRPIKNDIKGGNYFSFNIIFFVFLFFCSYLFPISMGEYDIMPQYKPYINKATALVSVAVSLYSLGWQKSFTKSKKITTKIYVPQKIAHISTISSVLMTVLWIASILSFIRRYGATSNDIDVSYMTTLVSSFLTLSLLLSCLSHPSDHTFFNFIKHNYINLICYSIIILSSLYIGDRTVPIYFGLSLISIYSYYIRKFKLFSSFAIIIIAFFSMYVIGQTRKTENSLMTGGVRNTLEEARSISNESESLFDYFSDLNAANSTLYLFTRWREDNNGSFFYPAKILIIILSPIPYIPTTLSVVLFGVQRSEIASGTLSHYLYNKDIQLLTGGLGTHIVGDIYVSWGLVGVIILFFLLGCLSGKTGKEANNNIYSSITYLALVCSSVYMPRATMWEPYRIIVFQFIILYIYSLITSSKVRYIQ